MSKKIYILFLFLFVAIISLAQEKTTIPDITFRNYIENYILPNEKDFDDANQILTSKIDTIKQVVIERLGVESLKGIEDFRDLESIYAELNSISTLDLSNNTKLTYVSLVRNSLVYLNIANGSNKDLNDLLIKEQDLESTFLECVQLDNGYTKTTDQNWEKDDSTTYNSTVNTPCKQYTFIPDENFRNTLISTQSNISNSDFFGNNIETSKIKDITTLDISKNENTIDNEKIVNLLGIEDFTSLTELIAGNNKIQSLDLSDNIALTTIYLDYNQIKSLDLSKNINLVELGITDNNLENINISQNTNLKDLYIFNNQLQSIDVSQNTKLEILFIDNNKLQSLDVSQNNVLEELNVTSNPNLTCIQVNQTQLNNIPVDWVKDNTQSFSLDCSATPKTQIPDAAFRNALINHDSSLNIKATDFDNDGKIATYKIANITNLDVSNKEISDLTGIEDFIGLRILSAKKNKLTNLDISKNTALEQIFVNQNELEALNLGQKNELLLLHAFSNKLKTLNLEGATKLKILLVSFNEFESLNVSQNTVLESFWANENKLESINVTQNTVLTDLRLDDNKLTNLDISSNKILTTFNTTNNPNLTCIQVNQTQLDNIPTNWVKGSTQSFSLDCTPRTHIPDANFRKALIDGFQDISSADFNVDNKIATVKISGIKVLDIIDKGISDLTGIEGFTALTQLNAEINSITNLDISQNTELTVLSVFGNQLTSLDVSKNIALTKLEVDRNKLTNLDVSKNTALTNLNVKINQLTSLDVSHNINVQSLQVYTNPNLKCIKVNQTQLDNIPTYWLKDSTQSFSLDCTPRTHIPDANFRQALIDGFQDISSADFNVDNKIATAKISGIKVLDIIAKGISDLTGIEGFTALTQLYAEINSITNLDISQNTELTVLNVSINQLTSLDVSKNTALTNLNVSVNQLTSLDVSKNIALTHLNVSNIQLTNLDVSKNIALTILEVDQNKLTNLDVSKNTALTDLNVSINQLTSLDVSKNTELTTLDVTYISNLTCIQVNQTQLDNIQTGWRKDDKATYSTDCSNIWVINTQDAALDTALASLASQIGNGDSDITLAEAAAYSGTLDLSNKGIANVDGLEAFTSATGINLKNNSITNIDILNNLNNVVAGKSRTGKVEYIAKAATQLQVLDVSGNQITSIDVTNLQQLTSLNVSGNQLTSLLLNNGNNAALITLDATNNANLGCIQTDDNFTPPNTWQKEVATIYSTNCNAALSVTSQNLNQFISLYPNPAKNILQVAINSNLHVKAIEIYDALGKRILKTKNISINIQSLAKGVFLTKIITDKGLVTARFVKE